MFHPYSFYLQKHKKMQKSNESLPSHFSASPYYSTSLSIPPMPQTGFYYVPFHHLEYPISPFGMSHFAFWGIPFYLLGYPILPFGVYFRHICAQCTAPIFCLSSSFFATKMCTFFVCWENWFSTFLHFCVFVFLHFANAKLLPFGNSNKFHCAHLLAFLMNLDQTWQKCWISFPKIGVEIIRTSQSHHDHTSFKKYKMFSMSEGE